MVQQAIDQRTCIMARRRMDDKTRRLVDDNQICILENDGERHGLGHRLGRFWRWDQERKRITGSQLQRRIVATFRIDRDKARFHQSFEPRARQIRCQQRQNLVEALSGLLGAHQEAALFAAREIGIIGWVAVHDEGAITDSRAKGRATGMAKETLTGVWHGLYSYPRYSEPVYFMATIIQAGKHISGSTHEAVTGSRGAPLTAYAQLEGALDEAAVSFNKAYDGSGGWKHKVLYSGSLSEDRLEIEGEWHIPGDWSGRFLMIRKGGATEQMVRKVYEKA
jgi:hypothetical protein